MNNKVHAKNIRATALSEFWGTDYRDSLYLWEGAKHTRTLREIEKITDETLSDLFASEGDIVAAGQYCRQVYSKILPRLAAKLNEMSGIALPDAFWQTAFGYWLFRHICIVYDKYAYLSQIDIDRTSIKLLDEKSFFIPYHHYDYVECFCNDFGVQQLVTQYYCLFKTSEFPAFAMELDLAPIKHKNFIDKGKVLVRKALRVSRLLIKKILPGVAPQIALCGLCSTASVVSELLAKSKGRIASIDLPAVNTGASIDLGSRTKLLEIKSDNDFERYLVQTLCYCLPRIFIEHFREHYDVFLKDIKRRKFKYIVSENIISHIPSSIYLAISQNEGRKLICYEHSSGTVFDNTSLEWITLMAADIYLTVGWELDDPKARRGGFLCRDIKPYQFSPEKKSILYVARTNFPYLMEFDIINAVNTKMIRDLRLIRDFYDLLPETLRPHYAFRPRRADNYWDIEHSLEVKAKNIQVYTGNFSEGLLNARVVIIDHLSTGAAEILLMKVPCLIIQNKQNRPFLSEIQGILSELKSCGVLHDSAESAVLHLTAVYDDVQQWWNNEAVQAAVNKLVSKTLAPPSQTIDYLLTCLSKDALA